jgi:hypothetical protein
MSKNSIARAALDTILADNGFTVSVQAGFTRVNAKDGSSRRIYISNTKTVSRIDCSGFVPPEHVAITPMSAEEAKSLRLGAVRGQVDFTKTPEQIMEAFNCLLAVLNGEVATETVELKKKAAPVKKAEKVEEVKETPKTDRVAMIAAAKARIEAKRNEVLNADFTALLAE